MPAGGSAPAIFILRLDGLLVALENTEFGLKQFTYGIEISDTVNVFSLFGHSFIKINTFDLNIDRNGKTCKLS